MTEEGGAEGENMSMGKLGASQAGRVLEIAVLQRECCCLWRMPARYPRVLCSEKFIEFPLVSVFYFSAMSTLFTAMRTFW